MKFCVKQLLNSLQCLHLRSVSSYCLRGICTNLSPHVRCLPVRPVNSLLCSRWYATGSGRSNIATTFADDPEFSCSKNTSITFLNDEQHVLTLVAYSPLGFGLNNGIRVMGPCAVFPKSVLHWNVSGVDDITEDSLELFTLLTPKIEVLVIGCGAPENARKVGFNIITYLKSHGIGVEILPTDQAISTFNILAHEGRFTAGAFIPPEFVAELGDARWQTDKDRDETLTSGHEDVQTGEGSMLSPNQLMELFNEQDRKIRQAREEEARRKEEKAEGRIEKEGEEAEGPLVETEATKKGEALGEALARHPSGAMGNRRAEAIPGGQFGRKPKYDG